MSEAAPPDAAESARGPSNRYAVDVRRDDRGWSVAIVDPAGEQASVRACRDEAEARTFASTVRQHAEWLSEERFRAYYRLAERG